VTAIPEAEEIEESAPQVAGPQAPELDDKVQVTPLLAPSSETVAVNVVVLAVCTETVAGETTTEIAGVGEGDGPPEDPLPDTAAQPSKNIAAARYITANKVVALLATQAEELSLKTRFS
jgi:hypothetical protein